MTSNNAAAAAGHFALRSILSGKVPGTEKCPVEKYEQTTSKICDKDQHQAFQGG